MNVYFVVALLPRVENDFIEAIQGLIIRRMGSMYLDQFILDIIPHENDMDFVTIASKEGKIHLKASSATAMGYGLHEYLKTIPTQTNWENDPLILPEKLPLVISPMHLKRYTKYTYYENVCTFSYSQWTWSWGKWQNHIDWMALNGINVPLAFTGQEKVWQQTYQRFNITSLDSFFAGAGFLAWGRMGNVQGSWVRGPLPQEFIDNQFQLQLKILKRMQSFGMIPALPAFGGHIPEELVALNPNAKVVRSPPWINFQKPYTSVYLLDPTDPLFLEIGKAFVEEQNRLFNYTGVLYQTDTYNEMDPAYSDSNYLKASSEAVLASMRAVNPKAVWLMQGWLFTFSSFWTLERIRSYIEPLPNDGLIMLDLYSDVKPMWQKTDGYFGKYWIYCVLHNFGGNLGMRGDLKTIAEDPIDARKQGNMIGIGLTMEGIFQNYIVYDLTLQMAWKSTKVKVLQYVESYAHARYNVVKDPNVAAAWHTLATTVYNVYKTFGGVTKNIVGLRPRWGIIQESFMPTKLPHDPSDIIFAWKSLLRAASQPALANHSSFQRDIVDITRQALSDALCLAFQSLEFAFHEHSISYQEMQKKVEQMKQYIKALDQILSTNTQFMLGPWLRDAQRLTTIQEQASYFIFQAKNQITRWGDNNGNALSDYASKDWAGLVSSYYLPRWEIWFDFMLKAYESSSSIDSGKYYSVLEDFELKWQVNDTQNFATIPLENSVDISRNIFTMLTGEKVLILSTIDTTDAKEPDIDEDLGNLPICLLDCLW
ncbi:alpha-N-acetylglucosaminidase (NAGLU) [Thraustotheca clavata]|uniref:Alpha-N-acetylglucosaminidase (NAGLU) n=1 Tax=Thraustotheca clavata TaxID=74557 RepID=A0A1V9ZVR9_9STRA|nr:alpha-N-acetylglucosaminidase (NAGLU) [Thraustotheca clavata]